MPDAKGVEGSPLPRPSLLRAAAAKRPPLRKPADGPGAAPPAPAPAPAAPAAPPPSPQADRGERAERERVERQERPRVAGVGSRLDDLYRMPMPELFALAEKEGIRE